MLRLITLSLTAALLSSAAQAQSADSSENGRFTMSQIGGDMLRLDTRTGQVSQCSRGMAGWTCMAVPDERVALEKEIGRLQTDLLAMRRRLTELEAAKKETAQKPDDLKLPTDAELDRVMTFMEKVWKRLIDMVQGTPIEKKS